jgi:hypothetical protein
MPFAIVRFWGLGVEVDAPNELRDALKMNCVSPADDTAQPFRFVDISPDMYGPRLRSCRPRCSAPSHSTQEYDPVALTPTRGNMTLQRTF